MIAQSRPRVDARIAGIVLVAIAGLILALIRIPTSLGVRVEPTTGIGGFEYDKSGHERVWRVWWRARDDLFDLQTQWPLTAGLIVLFSIFVTGVLAAVWIALSPDESTPDSLSANLDETA